MANTTLTQFSAGASQYKINFDYLSRQYVVLTLLDTLNPTNNKVLVPGNDYKFLNPTTVQVLASQVGYQIMQIHRFTSSEPLVEFKDGSVLTGNSLTTAELQAIHIAEEGRDQTVLASKQFADAALEAMHNAQDARDRVELLMKSGLYGYVLLSSFQTGATLSLPNHALKDETNGEYYRWDGPMDKVVPANSSPASTGGEGPGAWLAVGYASLRQELLRNGMVNMSPLFYGAVGNGAVDDTSAFDKLESETTGRVIDLGGRSYAVTKSYVKNTYINGSFLRGGSKRMPIGTIQSKDKQLPLVHSGMPKAYALRNSLRRTTGAGGIYAVIQGAAHDEVNDRIFTLSSTSARGYCINSFRVTNSGILGTYDRTRSFELGHQGLGLHHLPDGSPVLWTSKPYQAGAADQCVSMEGILNYTGTTDGVTAGFTTWQLFPASTDSASTTPTVSACQNYLIAKRIAADGQTCTVRVFDLKAMWANKATKVDYSTDYLVEFTYQKPDSAIFTQSLACDGTYIYILESHTYTEMSNYIYVFDMLGTLVDRVDITTVGDKEAIRDNTSTPIYKEPGSLMVVKTKGGYALNIGICTPVGTLDLGKNVYLFDLGMSTTSVQSANGLSVYSESGIHSHGAPTYKYGADTYNDKFHWTVNPTRRGITTNLDNPVLFLDGGVTGGLQLASNGSEGMSNSWASRHDNAAEGPRMIMLKSRNGVVSTDTFGTTQAGDRLGTILWAADTGSKMQQSAHIKCVVAGPPTVAGAATILYFGTTMPDGSYGDRWALTESGHWRPSGSGLYDIGTSANPVRNTHMVNAPIVTSSRAYKTDETPLTEAELRVGLKMYSLVKKFRMKAAVAEKGDTARYHVGIIAEDVQKAFEDEGLDAFRYGILCYSKWDAEYEKVTATRQARRAVKLDPDSDQLVYQLYDEEYETGELRLVTEAGEKLAVRAEELMYLALQASHQKNEQDMKSVLERLAALEAK